MRILIVALILCCGPTPSSALAQQPPTPPANPQPSLADLAKKASDAKASQPKATKKFDNDSLKQATPTAPASPDTAVAEKPSTASGTSTPKPDPNALEKSYRGRFSQLRAAQKAAEAEDKHLHDEMNYAGPNSAAVLHPYYNARTIQVLQSEVDANNKKIAGIKQQLEDLTEELRKRGLPARWAEQ
jgi:hypothetical protein